MLLAVKPEIEFQPNLQPTAIRLMCNLTPMLAVFPIPSILDRICEGIEKSLITVTIVIYQRVKLVQEMT